MAEILEITVRNDSRRGRECMVLYKSGNKKSFAVKDAPQNVKEKIANGEYKDYREGGWIYLHYDGYSDADMEEWDDIIKVCRRTGTNVDSLARKAIREYVENELKKPIK